MWNKWRGGFTYAQEIDVYFFPNLAQLILHSTLVENGETEGLGITKQIEMSEFLSLRVT